MTIESNDIDNSKCNNCGSENQLDNPICLKCGKSLCKSDIMAINRQKDSLIEKYKVCYEVLKRFREDPYLPQGYRSNNINTIHHPLNNNNLQIIDKIPNPQKISPLDVVAFADSVSRYRLECFFRLKMKNGELLGEYLRKEILYKYNNDRLSLLYNNEQLWPRYYWPLEKNMYED